MPAQGIWRDSCKTAYVFMAQFLAFIFNKNELYAMKGLILSGGYVWNEASSNNILTVSTYDTVKNIKVTASVVSGWWKDTGKPEDVLHQNRLILDDLTSEIKGPALIGRNCVIQDSYIGFYTSIGNNCKDNREE